MKLLVSLLLPMFALTGCYTQLANDDEYSGSDYYEYYGNEEYAESAGEISEDSSSYYYQP